MIAASTGFLDAGTLEEEAETLGCAADTVRRTEVVEEVERMEGRFA